MSETDANGRRLAAQNRKARYEYFITDEMEAGIVLTGTEIKAIRAGRCSIGEAHAGLMHSEIYLFNAHILDYGQAGKHLQHEPRRPRKLLLHAAQIRKLLGAIKQKGVTLIPLDLHFNDKGRCKVSLGLATGKKKHDKRETEAKRDWDREKSRLLRQKSKSYE